MFLRHVKRSQDGVTWGANPALLRLEVRGCHLRRPKDSPGGECQDVAGGHQIHKSITWPSVRRRGQSWITMRGHLHQNHTCAQHDLNPKSFPQEVRAEKSLATAASMGKGSPRLACIQRKPLILLRATVGPFADSFWRKRPRCVWGKAGTCLPALVLQPASAPMPK